MDLKNIRPINIVLTLSALAVVVSLLSPKKEVKVRVQSNPRRGGWSRKKIAAYNRKMGTRLKHGVDYDPITLEDFKRKGSWAVRHYKRKNSWQNLNMAPLMNDKGELLPFSTQAVVWGEKPPKNRKEQKRLVNLGERLLKVYRNFKRRGYKNYQVLPRKVRKGFVRSLKRNKQVKLKF